MLIQSYSGTIRLFPAVPASWKNVSFEGLRAEGAFVLSAERKVGKTTFVEIQSDKGGECRIENPFADQAFRTDGIKQATAQRDGTDLVFAMPAGSTVRLVAR